MRFGKHKITYLLLLTVVLGSYYQLVLLPELAGGKVIHWNGEEGMSEKWHVFFIFRYIIGFILVIALLYKPTKLDRDSIISYLVWDVYGFFSYLWIGWPEPVHLIVFGFLTGLAAFFILRIWKYN